MSTTTSTERHYRPSDISKMWALEVCAVRRMFANEPGVIVFDYGAKPGKRQRKTYRIPQSVMERVHRRMKVGQ